MEAEVGGEWRVARRVEGAVRLVSGIRVEAREVSSEEEGFEFEV